MRFKIAANSYDDENLPLLGGGSFGDVYSLKDSAAKILYQAPKSDQITKLSQLTTLGQSFDKLPEAAKRLATLPKEIATQESDDSVVGYEMNRVDQGIPLFDLNYDPMVGSYRTSSGTRLDDQSAVSLVYKLFVGLTALSSLGITIGDLAPQNILVARQDLTPCFIDLDDACYGDFVSESLGTPGYVDPRLLDLDRNELDGLPFDSTTDLYAITIIAFRLLFGFDPYALRLRPVPSSHDFKVKNRLTSYRLFRLGLAPIEALGLELTDDSHFKALNSRIPAISNVAGRSGRDGEILIEHFDHIFLSDQRENLLELLPDGDVRRPEVSARFDPESLREQDILDRWGVTEIFSTLAAKRGPTAKRRVNQGSFVAQANLNYDPDPKVLDRFLAARGLAIDAMLTN